MMYSNGKELNLLTCYKKGYRVVENLPKTKIFTKKKCRDSKYSRFMFEFEFIKVFLGNLLLNL